MYNISSLKIAVILQILVEVLAENKTKDTEALEKEKGELFKQINEAIDDSVRLLSKGNDSEAVLGVHYMQQLREQLKEVNGTDVKGFKDLGAQTLVNETRRTKKLSKHEQEKKVNINLEREKNKIIIKKKIDEWYLQREIEKQKIREYKEEQRMLKKQLKLENCPRYGVGSKSKKTRRADDDESKEKKPKVKKTLPKYPCCRKCCKKSYMGCL